MNTFSFKITLPSAQVQARFLMLLLLAVAFFAVDPAFAVGTVDSLKTDATFGGTLTKLLDMQTGLKATIAIVGFLSALVSLVVMRSFTAALFLLGIGVFGSAGLQVIEGIMGAPLSLI